MSKSSTAKRREYDRYFRGGYGRTGIGGRPVIVPANVQMIEGMGAPCFLCGQARGCKHQPWSAVYG